ncbi:uncharacterized protein LOC143773878 [Ranitomeya variabilis]|uniref:uncharacterized protein LOC143773878 n=1 Tax=Ranitomeya variabilis TaxID=490064 RepID=UPI00405699A0
MFKQEAESDEELSEGVETGGEMQVVEEPSSPAAHSQHREGSPSRSQSRRNRRRGRPSSSQRAPAEELDETIDVDHLIDEVCEREPLWNMADRRHADTHVTRRLWEEVCQNVLPRWEDLHPQQQSKQCGKVRKRWRSLRDRYKREFNQEMQALSGSAGRRTWYKHSPALSFFGRASDCWFQHGAITHQ